jgi:hypothetical protein
VPVDRLRSHGLGRFACPNLVPYPGPVAKAPKKTCCMSKPRCDRCPIRMLAEGRLEPQQAKKIFSKARNKKALKKAKLTKAA